MSTSSVSMCCIKDMRRQRIDLLAKRMCVTQKNTRTDMTLFIMGGGGGVGGGQSRMQKSNIMDERKRMERL
jgi:hypothetical protein